LPQITGMPESEIFSVISKQIRKKAG
jgi:hypothetical protein